MSDRTNKAQNTGPAMRVTREDVDASGQEDRELWEAMRQADLDTGAMARHLLVNGGLTSEELHIVVQRAELAQKAAEAWEASNAKAIAIAKAWKAQVEDEAIKEDR